MKISIIGIGRVGGALALALAESGYKIEHLVTRNSGVGREINKNFAEKPKIIFFDQLEEISSDIIFITTQDFEIPIVVESLVRKLKNKPFVFHTSGSLSSEVLQNLKSIGCRIGSIHPLVSISDAVVGAKRFEKAYFCVEGDQQAVEVAEEIVKKLKGKPFSVETRYKSLYHASAVTACGHLIALIDISIEMLSKCGLNEKKAREILLPLIKSTIENLSFQTTASALTGTFARADVETLEKHLETLRENVSNEVLEVYLQLGNRSTHLAEVPGANAVKLAVMREKLSLAKKNLK